MARAVVDDRDHAGEPRGFVQDGRDEIDPCHRSAIARDDFDLRTRSHLAGVCRRQGQRDRDTPKIGDTEQFRIGRDCLTQRHAARDDLPREGRADRDAIERASAAARRRHLLLRET